MNEGAAHGRTGIEAGKIRLSLDDDPKRTAFARRPGVARATKARAIAARTRIVVTGDTCAECGSRRPRPGVLGAA